MISREQAAVDREKEEEKTAFESLLGFKFYSEKELKQATW